MIDCQHRTGGGLCRHAKGPLTCRMELCHVAAVKLQRQIDDFIGAMFSAAFSGIVPESKVRADDAAALELEKRQRILAPPLSSEERESLLRRLSVPWKPQAIFPGVAITQRAERPGLCWEVDANAIRRDEP